MKDVAPTAGRYRGRRQLGLLARSAPPLTSAPQKFCGERRIVE